MDTEKGTQTKAKPGTDEPTRDDWPEGVRPISWAGLGLFGMGRDNTLYWNGKEIQVRKRVRLTWWQGFLATIAALGAFASGVTDLLTYIHH